jgi:hypothetical protein
LYLFPTWEKVHFLRKEAKMQNLAEPNQLVDICSVSVGIDLPKVERLIDYVRQIKDPYNFICDGVVFHVDYARGTLQLEDCFIQIMS